MKNTRKVREICQSEKVGTMVLYFDLQANPTHPEEGQTLGNAEISVTKDYNGEVDPIVSVCIYVTETQQLIACEEKTGQLVYSFPLGPGSHNFFQTKHTIIVLNYTWGFWLIWQSLLCVVVVILS